VSAQLPIGEPVTGPAARAPQRTEHRGRHVRLAPLDSDADAPALFAASHASDSAHALWTYMAYGPFADAAEMRAWLEAGSASRDPLFFTVHDLRAAAPAGMAAFLNVVCEHRHLEIGHLWYAPALQRTAANTETVYLMLVEAFDRLGHRRVEWKCDALNARSRAAARRLGFSFEGIFQKHAVVKGRSRDTAWYALLDDAWPAVRANLESWLFDPAGPGLTERNAPLLRPGPADSD